MEGCNISDNVVAGLVSVIVPTHNRVNIIGETIDSIFAQSYSKIELIIIDDHSTDDTEDQIKQKLNRHPLYDFQYLKSEKSGGCAARNLGLSVSKGEYIQFFDDDDVMASNHIADKVLTLQTFPQYDFVTCNFEYFKGDIKNIVGEKRLDNIVHSIESHLLKSAFPAPAFMCRRSCIYRIGLWNENILKFQDICYFHRLFLHNLSGCFMNSNLFYVRLHNNNISFNKSKVFYQSMLDAFNSVRDEWSCTRKMTGNLLDVIYLMKVMVLLQACRQGYYFWCISKFLGLSLRNLKQFCHFIKIALIKLFRVRNDSCIYDIMILGQ